MARRLQILAAAVALIVPTVMVTSRVTAATDRPATSFISHWEPSNNDHIVKGPMTKATGMKISAVTFVNADTTTARPTLTAYTTKSSSSCFSIDDESTYYMPVQAQVPPGQTVHLTYPSVLDVAHPAYYGADGDQYWCLIFYPDDGINGSEVGVTVVGP
jgi:hypothetical protein